MSINEQIFQDFKEGRIDSLYTQEYPSLKAFAARYLTDNYAIMAEDCVQDAIVNAYQARNTLNSPLQMKAFLYTCIRNACISILRKTDSHKNYLSEQEHEQEYEWEISAAIIEQETIDRLHAAIRELPEKYRQIFNLDYEQGLRHTEIAKQLGITIDGVTKRKAKMLALLREKFKEDKLMQIFIALISI